VVLHSGWDSTVLSISMGVAIVGRVVEAAAVEELVGVKEVVVLFSCEIRGALVSIGVEEVSFMHLEAGMAFGSGSQLENSEGSHPTWKGQASGLGPWWGEGLTSKSKGSCWSQEGVWLKSEREGSCTLGVGVGQQTVNKACK